MSDSPTTPLGAIHQLLPSLDARHEVAQHAVNLQRALRQRVERSEILVDGEVGGPGAIEGAISVREYVRRADRRDSLVCHFSPSWGSMNLIVPRCDRLVIDYHGAEGRGGRGRAPAAFTPLTRLARRAVLGLVHTPGNVDLLRRSGCTEVEVVGLLVQARGDAEPDPRVLHRLGAGRSAGTAEWLNVGPCQRGQGQEDLVEALWAYRRLGGQARLHLVGPVVDPSHYRALRGLVESLGLTELVRFPGGVNDAALSAYLSQADVYLSLRGDAVVDQGLRAALEHRLPVVARWALEWQEAPVGLPIGRGGPARVAAGVRRVLQDAGLRGRLVEAGSRWLAAHRPELDGPAAAGVLEAALASALGSRTEAVAR